MHERRRYTDHAEADFTPLVDICLCLISVLLLFMTAGGASSGTPVSLAKPASGGKTAATPSGTVRIGTSGITWDGTVISAEDLKMKVAILKKSAHGEVLVLVAADRTASWNSGLELVEMLQEQ